ncbi:hypothetical protein RICGR_0614 [Rickettsiella grylli]|uniref:Uncharacterized protein n=1 Tax=Rickettsiella grylli TaxID=59196 RepID=A8PM42_9COXI|nr:hypothetical protein RICGR_0614 [Rickettsiella grylli]
MHSMAPSTVRLTESESFGIFKPKDSSVRIFENQKVNG